MHPKVVDRTAKEHRGQFAFEVGRRIPRVVDALNELHVLAQRAGVFAHQIVERSVVERVDGHHVFRHFGLVRLEQAQALVVQVVHALEGVSLRDRPGEGTDLDVELGFHLVQQVRGVAALEVHLVDEHNHRRVPHAAHLHEALGLGLHAFYTIDDQNHAVHRCQGPVGVLREIAVTGCVQEVDEKVLVVKRHHRRRHRDATLPLDFHEVRCGRLRDLVVLHRPRRLDGPTKQQKLLCQGGFPCIRVGDDGERSSTFDLLLDRGTHGSAQN